MKKNILSILAAFFIFSSSVSAATIKPIGIDSTTGQQKTAGASDTITAGTFLGSVTGTASGNLVSGGALGTPSSGTLTNCSGLPITGLASLGTSVATALGVNVGSAGAFVVNGGVLGTPSSGTLTNCTGLPAASVVAGTLGSGAYTLDSSIYPSNAIAASGNAATVPVTKKISTVTNNSAATLTITMTTAGATDGQMTIVRIIDFSAVAQTITWVNTENSTVTAPTTSNGSTTLPLTVGFMYNGGTSKWRCVASA